MRFIQDWDEKINLLKEIQQIDKWQFYRATCLDIKLKMEKESYEDFISTSMVIFEECNLPVLMEKLQQKIK